MDRFVKISGVVSLFVLLFLSCAGKAPEGGLKNDKFVREYEIVNHVEYRTGNAPLIISVPHDGPRTDDALVKRTKENCPDPSFSTARDLNTSALADLIDSVFYARTGKYPYMVIGKISRKYVDFNRQQKYAVVAGSARGIEIYNTYHNRAGQAVDSISKRYGAGLLLDIHGHGHAVQQIELGYLLKSPILNLSNEELEKNADYLKKCSIYNLVKNNKSGSGFTDLLRGTNSFGSILYRNGQACVPHSFNKSPGNSPYFSAGYITKSHGSSGGTGVVDAIQCEFGKSAREIENRKKTAEDVVDSVLEYMKIHYSFTGFELQF